MKTVTAVFLPLLLVAWTALPVRSARKGWLVECSSGFALLYPHDLNARLEAQQSRTGFLYRDSYEAQQRSSGGLFTYVLEEPEGSGLQGLRNGLPVILRIGRAVGPRIAVFAGLQFLDRQRKSWLQQTYRVSDRRPDQVTPPGSYVVDTGFPEYCLAARAWMPQLGMTVDLLQKRPWTAGVRLAAGPMFASLRIVESQYYRKTDAGGYFTEWQQVYDMKGKGIGIAVEAAARLALEIMPRLSLYVEGGYALRSGSRFSGPGSTAYQYRDANAAENPLRLQWEEGEWRTRRMELHRDWGDLEYTLSGNDLDSNGNAGKFRLDLSGWQLTVGLALAL